MQTPAEQMRLLMALTEAPAAYTGPRVDDPNVTYSAEQTKGEINKVIATLSASESAKYTKMGRNLKRIAWLSEKIDQLKEQVKTETREKIADLFHAEDSVRTRVIDTVSFTFKMTKDPVATESIQYSKVLEELQNHLTPELVVIMEGLKSKYSKVVEKQPALIQLQDKKPAAESIGETLEEGLVDSLKAFFHSFLEKVKAWGAKYDSKLDKLKAMAAQATPANKSIVDESHDEMGFGLVDQLVETAINLGKAMGGNYSDEQIHDWQNKVNKLKASVYDCLT